MRRSAHPALNALGLSWVILLIGMALPAPLAGQQQDPRPVEHPSPAPTTPLPARAGQPQTGGAGQPTRLPAGDRPASADRPFETWTVALPSRRGVTIWARNPAADTIIITRFLLADCFNLGTPCGSTDLRLTLGEGDSAEVITLQPKVWNEEFTFRAGWEWEIPSHRRMAAGDTGDEPPLPFTVWAQSDSVRREVVLMVRNTSPERVSVTGLLIRNCKNIAGGGCGTHPLDVDLAPGDSAATVVLRPKQWGKPFHINLKWTWISGPRE